MKYKISLFVFFMVLLFTTCTKDMVVEVITDCDDLEDPAIYEGEIAGILNSKCSYAGCHNGTGVAPGDYTTYSGLISITNNGKFKLRVLSDVPDMPPLGQTPEELLLTPDEFKLLKCWEENDFQEQ